MEQEEGCHKEESTERRGHQSLSKTIDECFQWRTKCQRISSVSATILKAAGQNWGGKLRGQSRRS